MHTICQNTVYRNQLFLTALHQNDLNVKQFTRQIEDSKLSLTVAT